MPQGLRAVSAEQLDFLKLLKSQQPGAHAVVDVVRVVGDLVGQIGQLRLQTRLQHLRRAAVVSANLDAQKTLPDPARLAGLDAAGVAARAVLQNPLARLKGEVQAVIVGIALFQFVDDPQTLQIVLKARAVRIDALQTGIQGILPGMPKRGVPQVMRQRNGLDQVFI